MNFGQLAENIGLEEDEYLELVQLFVETGISDIDRLRSAIGDGNAEEVVSAAHSLKGSSSNLGFIEVSEIAKKIETDARADSLEGSAEAVLILKDKMDGLAEAVERKKK